ncbi:MAG: hypothetical protein U0V70_15115 [Terriglobia bacterium]
MVLKVGNHLFDGPYESFSELQDRPGVYVIVCYQSPFYFPIDCGESTKIRESVTGHPGASSWKSNCKTGTLMVGALYTSEGLQIEKELRSSIFFPCRSEETPPSSAFRV